MDHLPPGIVYLIQSSPRLLSPPAIAYALLHLIASYYNTSIPGWVSALAMFMSLPLALTISVVWSDLLVRRDAARMGAELPPMLKDPLPGGMSRVLKAASAYKTGYPGKFHSKPVVVRSPS